jgi:hypothetical protein
MKPLIQIDDNVSGKKKLKQANKRKKQLSKIKKTVLTTMDWNNIEEVRNNEIILRGKDKTLYHVMGVKLKPHDIFLDDPIEMSNTIERWRLALNKLTFKIYWAFVTSPVDIGDYKANLYRMNNETDDRTKKQMLMDDYEKAEWFEATHRELEFMMFVRESSERMMEKHMSELYRECKSAGFEPDQLLKRDFLNYISYLFDNKLINSTFFSKGVFQNLSEINYLEDEEVKTKPIDTDDYLYDESITDIDFATDDDVYNFEKSKYAPVAFSKTNDHMIVGENYMSAILITEMPSQYTVGLLCSYLNNPMIKVMMTTEVTNLNITAAIKKDRNAKLDELSKTADPTREMYLKQSLNDQQAMLDRVIRNNDKTLNMVLVFLVCADNKDDLYKFRTDVVQKLENDGFKTTTCKLMQEQVLRSVCPVLLDGTLPRQIAINLGVPLPAENISGLYPFVFETMKDTEGFVFGEEMNNGGAIIFDKFAYKRPYWANRHDHQRTNGNLVIVGKSGYGKSVNLNMTVRNDIEQGYNVVAIDPENKIFKLIKKYGGSIINYGTKNNIINIFDLRPLSSDEDDTDPNYDRKKAEEEMWDTKNAINFVIGQVNQIFSFLFKQYTDEEAGIMGDLIMAAYKKKGIDPDKKPSFKLIDVKDMPIFSDVKKELDQIYANEEREFRKAYLDKLQIKLNRVCGEWSVYLDGRTSLSFDIHDDRKVVAFGTKQLQNVSSELKTALNHIMYQYAWSLCIDNEQLSSFIIDEAHVNILQGEIANLTAQFVRRARKYNTCVCLATQEPRDFADPAILTHGKAIFNNCAYKLILHLDKDPAIDVSQLVNINENEFNLIMNFERTECLFICGERRIPIRVLATKKELKELS